MALSTEQIREGYDPSLSPVERQARLRLAVRASVARQETVPIELPLRRTVIKAARPVGVHGRIVPGSAL